MQNPNFNQPTENYSSALSWDSTISQESSFVLLEPGEYPFSVKKATRGMFTPKNPDGAIKEQSPQLELELVFVNEKGEEATVFDNLILHTAMEWKISEFFIAIGQKTPGQDFVPNWNVVGATGKAELEINKYKDKNGNERENNRVKNYLKPEINSQAQQSNNQVAQGFNNQEVQQPNQTYQAPVQQNQQQPQAQNQTPTTNDNSGNQGFAF